MTLTRDQTVIIDYTNYRGERRERRVRPVEIFYGESPWHNGPQWFLRVEDDEKNQRRDFAMSEIHGWRSA